jgi:hypothetical protein
MNEMPTSSDTTPGSPANRRRPWGRRRSDWLIPVLLLIAGLSALLWAWSVRVQKHDVEELNKGLNTVTQLRERQLRNLEKEREKAKPVGSGQKP